jgi:predicted anti-sigma-YlaC factor YlaD
MNCAEFQRDLPLIIDTGGNGTQEEHLRTCDVCRDLVSDLRYIAEQAKLLVPMEDPSPKVWDGIERRLKTEGLVKPPRARSALSHLFGK